MKNTSDKVFAQGIDLEVEESATFFHVDESSGPSPYWVLLVIVILKLVMFGWGNEYHLVDIDFGQNGLALILSLTTAVAMYAYLVWRDGWPSLDSFGMSPRGSALGFSLGLFFILPLFVGFLGYPGAARVANCLFDRSEPRSEVYTVHSVLGSRGNMEGGKRIWVLAESGARPKSIPIPRSQADGVAAGSELMVTSRSGVLGGEWITEAEVLSKPASR